MKKSVLAILCTVIGIIIGAGLFYTASSVSGGKVNFTSSVSDESSAAPDTGCSNSQLLSYAYDIVSALDNLDYTALSNYVHPKYGIYFCPYSEINTSSCKWFDSDSLIKLKDDDTKYVWGVYNATGEPIELTAEDYFSRFVYDREYLNTQIITIDRVAKSGNTLENVTQVFPDGRFVDFYYPSSTESNSDWSLLRLVFEPYNNTYRLAAIVHNENTF